MWNSSWKYMYWWTSYFIHSLQDFTDLTASSASFIPTVTAISTSPDLQWMVQPLISSVAPSHRAHPYTSSPSPAYSRPAMRSAASKAHSSTKRGRMEQVNIIWPFTSHNKKVASLFHRARLLTFSSIMCRFHLKRKRRKEFAGREISRRQQNAATGGASWQTLCKL